MLFLFWDADGKMWILDWTNWNHLLVYPGEPFQSQLRSKCVHRPNEELQQSYLQSSHQKRRTSDYLLYFIFLLILFLGLILFEFTLIIQILNRRFSWITSEDVLSMKTIYISSILQFLITLGIFTKLIAIVKWKNTFKDLYESFNIIY